MGNYVANELACSNFSYLPQSKGETQEHFSIIYLVQETEKDGRHGNGSDPDIERELQGEVGPQVEAINANPTKSQRPSCPSC